MDSTVAPRDAGEWPALPLDEWEPTRDTLQRWTQIVGKTRLVLAEPANHWWHCTLRVTPRGLGTGPMPAEHGTVSVDFDFVDHDLVIRTSQGATRHLSLLPRTVADFHREYLLLLGTFGIAPPLSARPDEVTDRTPFAEDRHHRDYDAAAVERFHHALGHASEALEHFHRDWVGKCSPVHFFWGSFDLAVTRFSGRRAPPRPGADAITREAYSHELISAGWWPGSDPVREPAFYLYAAPEPSGFAATAVRPSAAYYLPALGLFILHYDSVRGAADPAAAVHEFLDSGYEAAATLGGWDRAALERRTPQTARDV